MRVLVITEAPVIEFDLPSEQTGFDVGEAGVVGRLRKSQTEELTLARGTFDVLIALAAVDANLKIAGRDGIHKLRENGSDRIHLLPQAQDGRQRFDAGKEPRIR